jgi:hypothetical protein
LKGPISYPSTSHLGHRHHQHHRSLILSFILSNWRSRYSEERNGINKTLLSQSLGQASRLPERGTFAAFNCARELLSNNRVACVNLRCTFRSIARGALTWKREVPHPSHFGAVGGTLTGAARFLTVRFGLFPFSTRRADTIHG